MSNNVACHGVQYIYIYILYVFLQLYGTAGQMVGWSLGQDGLGGQVELLHLLHVLAGLPEHEFHAGPGVLVAVMAPCVVLNRE